MHPEKTPDGNAGSWIPNPQQPADSGTDGSRNGTRSNWPEWCVLSAYATLVACAIPYHEPWADEAQSWELARTLPLGILFKTYVRYEASPGLWHFLLWILSQAHVSYAGLHWICGAIAVASSYLLVFKSPLPRYLRLTLPFTYFLVFQYAVVARSYVLVPPILFMIAMGWKKRPLLVAVMLGLLANTSLHAAVISGGLAIVFGVVQITNGSREDPQRVRRLLLSATIVLGFYAFAIWTAWPPPDFLHTISNFRSESPSFAVAVIQSMVWGICEPWPLAIPFWIAIALWFYARRSLIYLLPVLLFAVFSGAVHIYWWHAGLLVPLVACLLWITWPVPGIPASRYESIGRGALLFLIGVQLLWSGYALVFDHYRAYSPDLAAARFLKPYVESGGQIAVTFLGKPPEDHDFWAVGIQPYFDHNIYMNQPDSFWWWSEKNQTEARFLALLPSHPHMVLAEMLAQYDGQPVDINNAKIKLIVNSGYRLTNVFCGVQPQRLAPGPANCHLIFQYPDGHAAD